MSILSTFPKKRKRRVVVGFVGTYIPQNQSDYITLYCNALEIPKIKIVKDLLTEWVNNMKFQYTIHDLIVLNAEKAYSVWDRTEGQSIETFIKLLQFELKKKKLPPEMVAEILKLVEDEKAKKK